MQTARSYHPEFLQEELGRLYNHRDDDSAQFTRHNMLVAIAHGHRLGLNRYCSYCDADREFVGGRCKTCGNQTAAPPRLTLRPAGELSILQGTALLAAILVVVVLAIAAFSGA